jgi:gluconate kinase
MVIVVMGEDEPTRNRCGRFLAENLGWEFGEIKCPDQLPSKGRLPANSDRAPEPKALYAAIESSIYEWRDMVVSCSILLGEDQRQIRHNSQRVEFVYLNTYRHTQQLAHFCETGGLVNSLVSPGRSEPYDFDDGVLTLNASEKMEQICSMVVSELILKHSKVRC